MSKYIISRHILGDERVYLMLKSGLIRWDNQESATHFEKEEAVTLKEVLNKFSERSVLFTVEIIEKLYTLQTSGKTPDDILYLCQLDKKVYDCELDVCVNIFWTRKSENALRVDKDTVKSYVKIIESLLNITPFVVTVDYDVLT